MAVVNLKKRQLPLFLHPKAEDEEKFLL